ncbi:hypothetical protein D3C86_1869950 [compost metagenome]
MDFNQCIHAELESGFFKRLGKIVINTCKNDKNAVCTPTARFIDLIGIEQEILA